MNSGKKLIGHRGWPERYPDNTLAGFIAATSVVDALELDVRRCSDGKLVLSHDAELVGHTVANHSWSSLAELDLGGGHRPALLDEVLSSLPGVPLQIEIKNDPWQPGYEPDHRLALDAAERARPGDVITSANWATVMKVRRTFPDVATGVILARHHDLSEGIGHCLEAGHSLLVPEHHLIALPLTGLADDLQVTPWVVNDLELARELVGFGVSGIITDDPVAVAAIRSDR